MQVKSELLPYLLWAFSARSSDHQSYITETRNPCPNFDRRGFTFAQTLNHKQILYQIIHSFRRLLVIKCQHKVQYNTDEPRPWHGKETPKRLRMWQWNLTRMGGDLSAPAFQTGSTNCFYPAINHITH